jgi:hypothetical protein
VNIYRLFHRTRLPQGIEDTDECLLEFYHQETLQQGGRVRDRLRDGVERAIRRLGTGFLQHQQNQSLRQLIEENQLISQDFYRLLLFLIYRLLFLMVAESRNLLLAGEDAEKVRIYREYYSIERLRALAERPSYRHKKERKDLETGQGSFNFVDLETGRSEYIEKWREFAEIPETTPKEIKQKQSQYQQNHSENNQGWWRDYSACNLWTAAFFMGLTEQNLQLLPTTEALKQLLNGNSVTQKLVDAANKLAEEKRFFHWCLEFPDVFEQTSLLGVNPQEDALKRNNGFDCVLGNPPWEMIQLDPREFFAARNLEIANAKNKSERDKLIKLLQKTNSKLLQELEDAKHDSDAQSKFIRESGRFPLTAVGRINTYAVFAETTRKIISDIGRVGIIVPSGIATNDTTKDFFGDVIKQESLVSLFGFTNWAFIFPDVGDRFAFCLLTLAGKKLKKIEAVFTYHCHYVSDLNEAKRYFTLSKEDIGLINLNTFTCPVFRSNPDAELTKKIYQNIPVLENEKTEVNPWGISSMLMFMMNTDSHLFFNKPSDDLLPLYEGKMFFVYDHRYGFYTDEMLNSDQVDFKIIPTPNIENLQNPNFKVNPRYWISNTEVENRLSNCNWKKDWLLVFRGITSSVNERTTIFSLLPKVGVGHSAPLIVLEQNNVDLISCLLANFSSLLFDFVTRQKLGGNNFSLFILKQLPIIPPDWYTPEDIEFISSRVLEF